MEGIGETLHMMVQNYLLQMLERDVHHRDPDVNSMWDLGWNGIVFAYVERDDVVRDVEKVLLDEFMSEIAKDFVEIRGNHHAENGERFSRVVLAYPHTVSAKNFPISKDCCFR
ncbi:hypothetical protein Ancab_016309 [Ancistrocladus abbreviatus]